MAYVKPKKHLGQHFLTSQQTAWDIVDALTMHGDYKKVLEIGPGTGVLTDKLITKDNFETQVIEIDIESVEYLRNELGLAEEQIISGDFLKLDLPTIAPSPVAIIGNFPYNISSQIFFKVYENRNQVTEVVCMIQKEVAERIVSPPGKKTNGILSILLQAYYEMEYLFTVPPDVFNPPPKVDSAVISMKRNTRDVVPCDEVLFKKVVKQAFSTRRKTLRNAMKAFNLPIELTEQDVFNKRAEQLGVEEFIDLTQKVEAVLKS
ncbi:16S rRNA (adenine(1518)-N(6)/adenine(1519)-N(6))-dimethyltransferase RsmA [Limibacter armeniacum]|uniref:16S rRNA (adenine(1518)-N(6)/adenine(1519)-N(6))- dimethyltransferase RsmA n=1 Tax=Limibacter armeniacum TaxID=466084 RepID=UPI002FE594B6